MNMQKEIQKDMKNHDSSKDMEVAVVGNKKIVSITEAARLNNVTRQAIYVAIKLNKLRATKDTSRWMISVDDLMEYRKQKYSRAKSVFGGELLFDNNKG